MIKVVRWINSVPLVLFSLFTVQLSAQEDSAAPFRFNNQIEHITDDLYRAGNGIWHSILLVTDEGIVLVDPLNLSFANWLKAQLDEQFEVPVRYVIYSHSHFDHVGGAAVFADATIVAHERVAINMDGRYPHMPGDMVDRNNNGVIDREDIMIPTNADPGICGMSEPWFEQSDLDKDGVITPGELFVDIAPPDLLYSDRMTLMLGGEKVELLHPGKNHGDDMTVVYFPEQRVVFAADMIADALVRDDIRSLPSACGPFDGTPMAEWIRSYQEVEKLDFDIFAGGHGDFFSKEDTAAPRRFLQDLQAAVSDALVQGLTLDEMKQQIKLEKYADWKYFERLREKNIEAAYHNLSKNKD